MAVYFIQSGVGGPIKIGSSITPHACLRQLQTGNPEALRLLVVIPGGDAEEKALHQRFADIRRDGEWFEPEARLLGFIEGMLYAYPEQPRADAEPADEEIFPGITRRQMHFIEGWMSAATTSHALGNVDSGQAHWGNGCVDVEDFRFSVEQASFFSQWIVSYYDEGPCKAGALSYFMHQEGVIASEEKASRQLEESLSHFFHNGWAERWRRMLKAFPAVHHRDGRCVRCGEEDRERLRVAYVVPPEKDGQEVASNLVLICFDCFDIERLFPGESETHDEQMGHPS